MNVASTPSDLADKAQVYYKALLSRDVRFDGRFFAGVMTTGVYCRPICPARKPKIENCRFYRSAAEAQSHGFRPCKRCRPESAPGSPAWFGTGATVQRALRLILSGSLNGGHVTDLAEQLGVSERHLRRLFEHHVGVSPHRYAAAHRLNVATQLLFASTNSLTDIAIASGYGSVRRFNAAFLDVHGVSPSTYRRESVRRPALRFGSPLQISLPYRTPYDWRGVFSFLHARSVPGLESTTVDSYSRSIRVNNHAGLLTVQHNVKNSCLDVLIRLDQLTPVLSIIEQVRSMFDVDADPVCVADALVKDGKIRSPVRSMPGIRVPGGWSFYEVGVRAILGQQISLSAANTLVRRLVETYGEANVLADARDAGCAFHFPAPEAVSRAPIESLGVPAKRAETLRRFSTFVQDRNVKAGVTERDMLHELALLPGIGPWTVDYVRMRGLKHPDAFPRTDLGIIKAAKHLGIASSAKELAVASESWRPWRSYAAMILWSTLCDSQQQDRRMRRRARR